MEYERLELRLGHNPTIEAEPADDIHNGIQITGARGGYHQQPSTVQAVRVGRAPLAEILAVKWDDCHVT